jgi:hypothetical protein
MSIIGSFRNITWSGPPYNTVSLNGTDNTVGTARTYDILGAYVVETITLYSKPPNGALRRSPHAQHASGSTLSICRLTTSASTATTTGTTVVETCGGLASTFNFTVDFCATNATLGAALLHTIHLSDAQTVGKFLGGQNFTTCEALMGANKTGTGTGTPTASSAVATFSGTASGVEAVGWNGVGMLWLAVMGAAAGAALL